MEGEIIYRENCSGKDFGIITATAYYQTAYQIDQSGKIEYTSKNTYLALANGETLIIKISSREKRKLIKTIKGLRPPHKTYIFQIFASLIFILLKQVRVQEVFIDNEYEGHQASIKESLVQLLERFQIKKPEIDFGLVGKKSNAHLAAISAYRGEMEVHITVKAEDVLKIMYGDLSTKKGWRPWSGRGNP